jgi:hypothetical protein
MAYHARLGEDAAVAALNAIVDLIDAGEGDGAIVLYYGAEPSYADDAAGTEVATCTCAATAYGAAAIDAENHWAEADLAADATDSSATGNANAVAYFRVEDAAGNPILQGTVGTADCDLNLNAVVIGAGASVVIDALQFRLPLNQA